MVEGRIISAFSLSIISHLSFLFIAGIKFSEPPLFAVGAGGKSIGVELVSRAPKDVEILAGETAHRHEVKETTPIQPRPEDLVIPKPVQKVEKKKVETQKPKPRNVPAPLSTATSTSPISEKDLGGQTEGQSSGTRMAEHGEGGGFESASPAYYRNPAPAYPREAREQRIEGVVHLLVSVDAGGGTASVEVKKTSGSLLLDEAAEKAVKKWRFRPASRFGHPVESRVEIPIRFRLEDAR